MSTIKLRVSDNHCGSVTGAKLLRRNEPSRTPSFRGMQRSSPICLDHYRYGANRSTFQTFQWIFDSIRAPNCTWTRKYYRTQIPNIYDATKRQRTTYYGRSHDLFEMQIPSHLQLKRRSLLLSSVLFTFCRHSAPATLTKHATNLLTHFFAHFFRFRQLVTSSVYNYRRSNTDGNIDDDVSADSPMRFQINFGKHSKIRRISFLIRFRHTNDVNCSSNCQFNVWNWLNESFLEENPRFFLDLPYLRRIQFS